MKKLALVRDYKEKETLGKLIVFDNNKIIYTCVCLELPWLDNEHNISCIPEGVYNVEKYSDTKHKNCFWVKDVPERTGILIHIGTYATGKKINTKGCILPGVDYTDVDVNGQLDVVLSSVALKRLNYYLPDKFKIHIF